MKKLLLLPALLLVACSQDPVDHSQMDYGADEHAHHHDMPVAWHDADNPASVDLVVHEDPKTGWNLQIVTENFSFSPQNASAENVDGEGHAHLYVNDEKITRLYGEWYYLGSLEPGKNEIRVDLNANDHSPYTVGGEPVNDVEVVRVE